MKFTLKNVLNSLAGVLLSEYPEYPVYMSPNQQGTKLPCFFIFFMPSSIKMQVGERFCQDLGVDIVFLQERNIINGNEKIHEIADCLDEKLEMFSYSDGTEEAALIRTSEREWKMEDEELHYQFHIRQRVAVPRNKVLMREMEENHAEVKSE